MQCRSGVKVYLLTNELNKGKCDTEAGANLALHNVTALCIDTALAAAPPRNILRRDKLQRNDWFVLNIRAATTNPTESPCAQ